MSSVHRRQGGFTFLWLLFLVAGFGVGMAALGTLWHTVVQREKEKELLFVGDQYRRAIESFRQTMPPDGQKRLPKTLEELLLDPRFPNTVRHLRRIYRDPITGVAEWGLLKDAQGGIGGVFSVSDQSPFKTRNFPGVYEDFAGKTEYRQWWFVAAGVSATPEVLSSPTPIPTLEAQPNAPDNVDASRVSRVFACQEAMEQDYFACTEQAMGNAGVLHACTDEASARHKACLEGS